MAANSNIEWCDATFNPWIGCTKVSPGCDHCYAARQDAHRRWTPEGWGGPRKRTKTWGDPVKWNAAHEAFFAEHGRRQRVFCASLADVFDNQVPVQWRVDLFRLIAETPNLDWLLLTKRIGNARAMIDEACSGVLSARLPTKTPLWPWPNVWLGATAVNQEEADRDVPKLLQVPARVRFLSMEPLLGPVDLQKACTLRCPNGDCEPHHSGHRIVRDSENGGTYVECICSRLNGLHWVICGGPGARPLHPDWARSLRDQCAAAGTPYFFKQWGEWLPWSQFTDAKVDDPPEQTRFATREFFDNRWNDVGRPGYWEVMDGEVDDKHCVGRVGKQAAGRLLDGVEHNGFPGA